MPAAGGVAGSQQSARAPLTGRSRPGAGAPHGRAAETPPTTWEHPEAQGGFAKAVSRSRGTWAARGSRPGPGPVWRDWRISQDGKQAEREERAPAQQAWSTGWMEGGSQGQGPRGRGRKLGWAGRTGQRLLMLLNLTSASSTVFPHKGPHGRLMGLTVNAVPSGILGQALEEESDNKHPARLAG